MKYISQVTLISVSIALIIVSFNVNAYNVSDEVSVCNSALEKGDLTTATSVAAKILKHEASNRGALLCKGRALGSQSQDSQGNYNEALSALELALKNSQAGLEQIITTIFIGNLHRKNNQNAEAIASYEKSLNISRVEKNEKFERINLNFIGDTYTQNKDLNAALTSYLAGFKLSMNDNERAESYEHLAATYSALGQHDLAIEHQLKAMLMQQKAGTLDDVANANYVLGQTYQNAKEYDNAESAYSKLLQFSKDNGGAYYEAKANFGLAQVKAAKGEKDSAKIMFLDTLKMAKNIGENELAAEIDAALNKLNN